MPYIPHDNRPDIDEKVKALANEIADALIAENATAEISTHYRKAFMEVADTIAAMDGGDTSEPTNAAQALARVILDKALGYDQIGAWTGELNYAVTMLIQVTPWVMVQRGAWQETLRYWLYAQTVGALTRTAYDLHAKTADNYIGNGLTAVFEDVKDEYKRRVNTAYEAAQIRKSGDCYGYVPFRTQLMPFTLDQTEGFIEIMLPKQEPGGDAS